MGTEKAWAATRTATVSHTASTTAAPGRRDRSAYAVAVVTGAAAVAGGWGEKDLAEVPRYFRDFMLQVYE